MAKESYTVAAVKFYLRTEGTLVIEQGIVARQFITGDTGAAVKQIMEMEPAWILRSGTNVSELKAAVEKARIKTPDTKRRATGRKRGKIELQALKKAHGDNWRIAADIDMAAYEQRARSANIMPFMRPFWAGMADAYKDALAEKEPA